MKLRIFVLAVNLGWVLPSAGRAHVSEQGFVLLLPTGAYTAAGVAVVALTVLALFALPGRIVKAVFAAKSIRARDFGIWPDVTSVLSLLCLGFGIYIGLTGPRDPLSNIMPLSFWTLGWVALVSLAAVFGNLWAWLNPWTGLYRLIGPMRPVLTLPDWLGVWPAILVLLGFAAFLLADIAPDDPARLAWRVLAYWGLTFAGLVVFGPDWLKRAELGHAIFAAYASLSPLHFRRPAGLGGPGWRMLTITPPRVQVPLP